MVLEFFRSAFGLASSFVKIPVVRADDDDDENELVDPQDGIRMECSKRPSIIPLKQKLDECNSRVRSRKKTRETCEEELHDLVAAMDHCLAESLFQHLK